MVTLANIPACPMEFLLMREFYRFLDKKKNELVQKKAEFTKKSEKHIPNEEEKEPDSI